MDREVLGLQRASKRLETATKAWNEAYRLYNLSLTALNQKSDMEKRQDETAASPGKE
jgi:hypothetical protein